MTLTKAEKLNRCIGCHDNYYNAGNGYPHESGDTPLVNGEECWSLPGAKPCSKMVYYLPSDMQKTLREDTLECWHNNFGTGDIIRVKRKSKSNHSKYGKR